MTLSNAKIYLGLSATATPTGTNVTGSPTIGHAPASTAFPSADVVYSFKVEATTSSDEATLTVNTGVVASTTGSPTITDGDGKDFEAGTIAMPHGDAILIVPSGDSVAPITVASSSQYNPGLDLAANGLPVLGPCSAAGTIKFSFTAIGQAVEVVVIGKSTS